MTVWSSAQTVVVMSTLMACPRFGVASSKPEGLVVGQTVRVTLSGKYFFASREAYPRMTVKQATIMLTDAWESFSTEYAR